MAGSATTAIAAAVLAMSLSCAALAQAKKSRLTIEPVVLDASESSGATLGLQWQVKDSIVDRPLGAAQKGEGFGDFEKIVIRSFLIDYKLSGTVTAAKERNPKNFLDALLDAKFEYSRSGFGAAGGLFGKYESDQSFDNRQSVFGLRGTVLRLGLAGKLDVIALDANYGQVDPSKDEARQAALGTRPLERYYRWDFEFLYSYPLGPGKQITAVEFNYRLYREVSPPSAVEQAGLDRHRLGTLRLGLKNDLFLAYSRGRLPFDRQSDKIFEIGWSHNLK
jgi:hypothetical protein